MVGRHCCIEFGRTQVGDGVVVGTHTELKHSRVSEDESSPKPFGDSRVHSAIGGLGPQTEPGHSWFSRATLIVFGSAWLPIRNTLPGARGGAEGKRNSGAPHSNLVRHGASSDSVDCPTEHGTRRGVVECWRVTDPS